MIYKNIYCNLVKITCIQRNVYSTSTISSKVKVDVLLKKKQKQEKRLLRLANQKLNQERKNKNKVEVLYTCDTKVGDKKDITCPLPNAYSSKFVEACWYDWWKHSDLFTPDITSPTNGKPAFVMCLPPPNVTGSLHLGHALGNSIQDAMARWHRMRGHHVLWNPGCDHAGIATQTIVEKRLWRSSKLTRHDLGREKFLDEVWEWKNKKGTDIYSQMEKLGSSLDWSRSRFTMDKDYSASVVEAFCQLHQRGLIYRADRMVNWCCSLNSTISDIEVETLQLDGTSSLSVPGYSEKVEFGTMTRFAYKLLDGDDMIIIVSTTRPETLLGDTAVAVHPDDERYRDLIGRRLRHPFRSQQDAGIPIIADTNVLIDFGTGAVKITPAHDHNDAEMAFRHDLYYLEVIDDVGNMCNSPTRYNGMPRFEARTKIIEELKELHLHRGSSSHKMALPVCSRTKDIVEPRYKQQWYVKCDEMVSRAREVVDNGQLQIPQQYLAQWHEWLKNTGDWCISRQLWWGHRIPAYRIKYKGKLNTSDWIIASNEEEACDKACRKYLCGNECIEVIQDEDVLDTWFSSALFPFAMLGWPNETEDYAHFYPTSILETAPDIMLFWVARMVMLGEILTGQLPFKQVLFHGIVRDRDARKMSKSLGNVIDPIDIINGIDLQTMQAKLAGSGLDEEEIEKASKLQRQEYPGGIEQCGSDALRFALLKHNASGHFLNVEMRQFSSARHFCNKIWQAYRFTTTTAASQGQQHDRGHHFQLTGSESTTDLWILSRLSYAVSTCNRAFETHTIHQAAQCFEQFFKHYFCDQYLEYSKGQLKQENHRAATVSPILHHCLMTSLRLLSPMMPFISEELYQRLMAEGSGGAAGTDVTASLTISEYPRSQDFPWYREDLDIGQRYISQISGVCLSLRNTLKLTKKQATITVICEDEAVLEHLSKQRELLQKLSRSKQIHLTTDSNHGDGVMSTSFVYDISGVAKLYIDLQSISETESQKNDYAITMLKFNKEYKVDKSEDDNEMKFT